MEGATSSAVSLPEEDGGDDRGSDEGGDGVDGQGSLIARETGDKIAE